MNQDYSMGLGKGLASQKHMAMWCLKKEHERKMEMAVGWVSSVCFRVQGNKIFRILHGWKRLYFVCSLWVVHLDVDFWTGNDFSLESWRHCSIILLLLVLFLRSSMPFWFLVWGLFFFLEGFWGFSLFTSFWNSVSMPFGISLLLVFVLGIQLALLVWKIILVSSRKFSCTVSLKKKFPLYYLCTFFLEFNLNVGFPVLVF